MCSPENENNWTYFSKGILEVSGDIQDTDNKELNDLKDMIKSFQNKTEYCTSLT